jgi:hypothetical protein
VYKVVNGKSPPESNRPKERKKTLDDFEPRSNKVKVSVDFEILIVS